MPVHAQGSPFWLIACNAPEVLLHLSMMSLLPVAIVLIAIIFLVSTLSARAEKADKADTTGPPEKPQEPEKVEQPPSRKHTPEPSLSPQSTQVDTGPAPFHFVEGKALPRPTSRSNTPPRRHPCRVCGVPSTKRCLRCKSAYYCSREHSTQDWRAHRPHCLPTLARSRSPPKARPPPADAEERARGLRPGDTVSVAAYFFGVDADAPRRVQVSCTLREPEEDGHMWHAPDFKEHATWPALGYVGVQRASPAPEAPPLGRALSLFFHEFGLLDGQRPNRCVERLVGGPGRTAQSWVGDIILLREERPDRYCDVAEEDLAPAIEYFRDYGRT
ncbi:hypothetical protein BC834DRAFT_897708 [Gloeopeniophorella convolvens]|nr:hypothetical protein BC834DRAFT_897708 [Gloeopeniophorella convolvens]